MAGKFARMLLIPVLAGLVATVAAYAALGQKQAQPAELEMVPALVARADVPARTPLTAGMFEVRQVPRELAAGMAADTAQVEGRLLDAPLLPGEALLTGKLVEPDNAALTYRVAEGMRAVTIKADEFTGVGGYVNPGDFVDVILVLPEKQPSSGSVTGTADGISIEVAPRPASARMLLERVRVLARGPAGSGQSSAGSAPSLTSYTIEIKPEQAVELALGEELGHFKVILRPAVEANETTVGELVVPEIRFAVNGK